MSKLKQFVTPFILIVMGIWVIANKSSSLTIIGIVMVAMSAVSMTLHVTNRESTLLSKVLHCVVDGLVGLVGAAMLIFPGFVTTYLRFLMGGIVMLYAAEKLWVMVQRHDKPPFLAVQAVAVLLGLLVMLIPWDEGMLPIAAGLAAIYTGIATIICFLFGRNRNDPKGAGKVVMGNPVPVDADPGVAAGSDAPSAAPENRPDAAPAEIPAAAPAFDVPTMKPAAGAEEEAADQKD